MQSCSAPRHTRDWAGIEAVSRATYLGHLQTSCCHHLLATATVHLTTASLTMANISTYDSGIGVEYCLTDFQDLDISGFYGPGAWMTWCITMVASWVTVLLGDYSQNLHFIVYALYTN